jgi:thiol:disulfide interchange protein DsbD
MLVVSFALWLGRQGPRAAALGWIVGVGGVVACGYGVTTSKPAVSAQQESGEFAHWSEAAVQAARARNVPVLVDYTAKWCITCQVNKRAVLATAEGAAMFRKHNTALFEADWTNEDPAITASLASFGRNSVPLYVVYPAGGGEPVILPQTLTYDIVEEALAKR